MQLDRLILHNFKIHRDLTVDFKPGINGIVGRNGQGKSSVIDAILFVFTGGIESGTKEETITVGEVDGYVRAEFTLEGKQGYIQRHLGVSKVNLSYDGKPCNKSSEVKELWNKLLQIDESIFSHVIIAKQGDIPLLFSGNDAIREKIFQKIFLVPNTERLRNIIWEKYIKTAPPPATVEDVSFLQANIGELVKKLIPISTEITSTSASMLTDQVIAGVITRINYLKKCKEDLVLQPEISGRIQNISQQVKFKEQELETLKTDISTIKIAEFTLIRDTLKANKVQLDNKLRLLATKKKYENTFCPSDKPLKVWEEEYVKAQEAMAAVQQNLAEITAKKNSLLATLDKYKQLDGFHSCPLCNQDIPNIADFILQQKKSLSVITEEGRKVEAQFRDIKVLVKQSGDLIGMEKDRLTKLATFDIQLKELGPVEFDQAQLNQIEEVIAQYNKQVSLIAVITCELEKLKGLEAVAKQQLANLTTYTGNSSIDEELIIMEEVLTTNRQRTEYYNSLKLEEQRLQTEIKAIQVRVEQSLLNSKENEKRDSYIKTLQSLYDLYHTTKFPRQLIQSYSQDVQDLLAVNVQKFNLPYLPKIIEGFKIQMTTKDTGQVVPKVSGGQKMIVGLSLRLALHSLFAQAFPIWIIDEGTTHLDQENIKLYFDVIRQLKKETAIKQVIIIDHNLGLVDVVDNVIRL